MSLGEAVAVLTRSSSSTDRMGDPVWTWTPETVENVLVRPLNGSDASDQLRPDGVRALYRLAFPKTWTEGKAPGYLAHARVALTARGMSATDADSALRVIGSPDLTEPCPTKWNLTCDVGRVDG